MPRRPRLDRPGLIHHVMNRGLAKRTVFETRADIRYFWSLLARAVRERRIEVLSFVMTPTHFHLVVRSLDGRLSETMRRLENAYVRWFNRTRRRDGPLFRGRFRSFPVESPRYLHTLFRYVDRHAIEAHLAARPEDYPYGSARHLAHESRRPRWLSRKLVDAQLEPLLRAGRSREQAYAAVFAPPLTRDQERFVARRLAHPARGADEYDHLYNASPEEVQAWMRRKAALADRTQPGLPYVDPRSVVSTARARGAIESGGQVTTGPRRHRNPRDLALVALLRDLAGERWSAIGLRMKTNETSAHRLYGEHRRAVAEDPVYARSVGDLAHRILAAGRPTGVDESVLASLTVALAPGCCGKIT